MSVAGRLARAREELAARGWRGFVATPSVNFTYLTGLTIERTERLVCLGVPVDGAAWIVCPAFEADRIAEACPEADLLAWDETTDPFPLAAARMAGDGGWAVEPTTAYHDACRLGATLSGPRLVDGAALFERLRRPKDAEEQELLRRAVAVAWEVHDEVLPTLAHGDTESGVAARVDRAFAERGCDGWSLIQFGAGSAFPHGEPGACALDRPQAVLIDWGGWRDGFTADLTRTYWWDGGIASAEAAPAGFRATLDVVRAAQRAGLQALAPGAVCGDVDEAARAVIREAGWGTLFLHRLGHGLGREIHEPPYLVAGSLDVLAPGDVVTVEPGVYHPGRFGVRWEDDVLVLEDGIEVLSRRTGEAMDP